MIMENYLTTNFTRSLQQKYIIYIAFISLYLDNIERIHLSSNYEFVETVDEAIYGEIYVDMTVNDKGGVDVKIEPVTDVKIVVAKESMWEYVKRFAIVKYLL